MKESTGVRKDLKNIIANNSNLTIKLQKQVGLCKDLKKRDSGLTTQVNKLEKDISATRNKLEMKESDARITIRGLREEIAEQKAANKIMKEEVTRLKRDNINSDKQVQKLKSSCAKLREQIESKRDDVELTKLRLKNENEKLQMDREKMRYDYKQNLDREKLEQSQRALESRYKFQEAAKENTLNRRITEQRDKRESFQEKKRAASFMLGNMGGGGDVFTHMRHQEDMYRGGGMPFHPRGQDYRSMHDYTSTFTPYTNGLPDNESFMQRTPPEMFVTPTRMQTGVRNVTTENEPPQPNKLTRYFTKKMRNRSKT